MPRPLAWRQTPPGDPFGRGLPPGVRRPAAHRRGDPQRRRRRTARTAPPGDLPGGRGFVTYRDLAGADAATIASWVAQTVEHYRADPDIERVEWKTRGHDHAPRLHEALLDQGFQPQEPESIMIGEAALLDVDVPLPPRSRCAASTPRPTCGRWPPCRTSRSATRCPPTWPTPCCTAWRRTTAWSCGSPSPTARSWGGPPRARRGLRLRRDLGRRGAARVAGPGIYRALTAVRARSALGLGKTLSTATRRLLPTDPRTLRPRRGLHHHAVRVAAPDRWLIPRSPRDDGDIDGRLARRTAGCVRSVDQLHEVVLADVEMRPGRQSPDRSRFTDPDERCLLLT